MTMAFAPALAEVGAQTVFATAGARPLPAATSRRDRVLPVVLACSLLVHAAAFLPFLVHDDATTAAPPREIPVELVQAPPAPKPKPAAPKRESAKPSSPKQTAAQRAPAKQAPAKQAPAKRVEEKPKLAQNEEKHPPKPAPAPRRSPPPRQAFKPVAKSAPEKPNTAERLKELLGPMPAQALPGATDDGTDDVSYAQLVLSKVAKAKKEGRYTGIPGYSTVAFTIGDHGEVQSVEIKRDSGDPSLNEEAIAMVKRGAPYPPPPPGGRRDYVITLRFQALP